MKVQVELRPERNKLYCAATFETPDGPILVDHIYIRPRPNGERPRVEMPARPAGQEWLAVVRIPDAMYLSLIAAVERALQA